MILGSARGLTLLELLIGTTLLGVLLAIAAPSLSSSAEAHRLLSASRETAGYLRAVRATAVARNRDARLIVADAGATLRTEIFDAGAWVEAGAPLVLDVVRVTTVAPISGVRFSPQGVAAAPATVGLAMPRGSAVALSVSILGAVEVSG